jgi:glycopeptide antibiotics resistance protein
MSPLGSLASPTWPTRRHYLWAAVFFLFIATVGSLAPFEYRRSGLATAAANFRRMLADRDFLAHISRTDLLANVLLFVPVGYCLCGAAAAGRGRLGAALRLPIVFTISLISSLAIEFSQNWFPIRTPALSDIVAQIIGAGLGCAAWLVAGEAAPHWIRGLYASRRAVDRLDLMLMAYVAFLGIIALFPLDLSISPSSLWIKYRRGWIVLAPFSDWRFTFGAVLHALLVLALFAPVGVFASRVGTRPERPRRGWLGALLFGAVVVLVVSGCQLLVVDRRVSTTDGVLAMAGIVIGVAAARRWLPAPQPNAVEGRQKTGANAWAPLTLAVVYALLLFAVFCAPFDWHGDPQYAGARLESLAKIPFAVLYRDSPLNAAKEIVRKESCLRR